MSKASVDWVILEDVALICSSQGDVPHDRWLELMNEMRAHRVSRCIGAALGQVHLTSIQRKQASEIADQLQLMSAVVTDEKIVRAYTTALSWVGVQIKSFAWADLDEAVRYLKLSPATAERAEQEMRELRARVQRAMGGMRSA
ncbi:MAG TPA: hypothetical protein VH877_29970 [Polyangia bacterium]|jgi:hypothetical protein|nr:hypothetical protein [Polyangia bacterium]